MEYEDDPVFNTDERRAQALQSLLFSPLWKELLEPAILLEMQSTLEAMLKSGVSPSEILGFAGEARRLRWILGWPKTELDRYNLTKEREKEYDIDKERAEFFVEHGHRSSIVPPEGQPLENGEI